MDDLNDILANEAVFHNVGAVSKKALFQTISGLAASQLGLDARHVGERLAIRERLGSTGFGGGVAIPHGKIEGLGSVVGLFVKLAQPLDYGAIDGLPVDIVFVLLSPQGSSVEHLKALARVSRRLRDRAFVAKLRGAGSADALYALFSGSASRDAA